jgi:hypothetical protein
MRLSFLALPFLLAACAPAPVETMQAPPAGLRGGSYIYEVNLEVGPGAKPVVAATDEKAAAKRAVGSAGLPLRTLLGRMIKEGAAQRGLKEGRALTVGIALDRLSVADAGAAFFGGADRLAGQVQVTDSRTGERLALFYVDVNNRNPGLIGLAVRGGGVREKLASAFARHVLDQLAPARR